MIMISKNIKRKIIKKEKKRRTSVVTAAVNKMERKKKEVGGAQNSKAPRERQEDLKKMTDFVDFLIFFYTKRKYFEILLPFKKNLN